MNVTPDLLLATCAELPAGDPDTIRLARHLTSLGLNAAIAAWDDPGVAWTDAPLTVIRSTWDYHRRRDEFLRWTERIPGIRNRAGVVAWNSHKAYLLDLADRVPVIPSRILVDPSADDVRGAMTEERWEDGVLKPAIGLDGHGVQRVHRADVPDRAHPDGDQAGVPWPGSGAWVLQPFLPKAATQGEISVILVEGHPTHAVLRRPSPGEFRSQERLGGTVSPIHPPPEVVALARAALEVLDEVPLYARVDVVRHASEWTIMELELVEPSLFLAHGTAGLDALGTAIERLCR